MLIKPVLIAHSNTDHQSQREAFLNIANPFSSTCGFLTGTLNITGPASLLRIKATRTQWLNSFASWLENPQFVLCKDRKGRVETMRCCDEGHERDSYPQSMRLTAPNHCWVEASGRGWSAQCLQTTHTRGCKNRLKKKRQNKKQVRQTLLLHIVWFGLWVYIYSYFKVL